MKQEAAGNREEVPPESRHSRQGIPAVHGGEHVKFPSPSGPRSGLDRLLSDPTRLAIMSVLCAADWCDFAFLRDAVSLSDSALS